jgi:hypothetical protein
MHIEGSYHGHGSGASDVEANLVCGDGVEPVNAFAADGEALGQNVSAQTSVAEKISNWAVCGSPG